MDFQTFKAFVASSPILWLALAALTVALVFTEIKRLLRGYKSLAPAELTRLINREDALVIDLSAIVDFEKGHIAGSRNAQSGQFGPEHKLAAAARSRPLVLVCRDGNASAGAAAKLKKAGFEQVNWLEGGIAAWRQAELPLVKGR
ncbi:MAG: rhodanese-like domain-containing protein [Pseudoxanthomonas sp.]